MAQLKFSLKTNIVKSLFFDIYSNISRYYYAYGKSTPWDTVTKTVTTVNTQGQTVTETVVVSDEDNPPGISQTYSYEASVRKDLLFTKAINAGDGSIVIRRINWVPGLTYDMYDDYNEDRLAYSGAATIDQANFYVLTSEFNVYKCLYNNNGSPSYYQPSGTSTEAAIYADNYIWKFMYTIPLYLRNKFLTTSWMPCTTALTNQFYSNGSITSYSVEDRGLKYAKNTWSVTRINVLSGGAHYDINDITITFPNPEVGNNRATAEVITVGGAGNIVAIAITNQGGGYTSQPIPVIASTVGSGFQYSIDYAHANEAYTELIVHGDGYNAENPYSLKQVTITNRGEFVGAAPPTGSFFTFPSASIDYGYRPEVTTTFRLKTDNANPSLKIWEVDTVAVTNQGFGYAEPFVFGINVVASVLTAGGFTCDLNASTQKNEAELIPLINDLGEIEAIRIKAAGKGYTYAYVEIIGYYLKEVLPGEFVTVELSENTNDPGYLEGFRKASILLNFGLGDIETKQSNVELLAVDGAIPVIVVENGGNGYTSTGTTITISGDGTGCTAVPVVVNGSLVSISVTNPGSGYKNATVTINGVGSAAVARAIISPHGGHGKDAVNELYANTLMLVNRIGAEKTNGFDLTNDYRQIVIIKSPKEYNSDNYFTKLTGTSCALVEVPSSVQNIAAFNAYQLDGKLTLVSDPSQEFYLVNKYTQSNKYYLLLQLNTNYLPSAGNIFVNENSLPISISSVTRPDFNKYSGEMLYIDNRVKFASTAEQTIVSTTLISF